VVYYKIPLVSNTARKKDKVIAYITDPEVYSLEGIISFPSSDSSGRMDNVERVVATSIQRRLSTRYIPGQLLKK